MKMHMLIGIGFLLNVFMGPLCMASAASVHADDSHDHPVVQSSDCPDCPHHEDAPSKNCIDHCLRQSKNTSTPPVAAPTASPAIGFPIADTVDKHRHARHDPSPSAVRSRPTALAVTTIVLRE